MHGKGCSAERARAGRWLDGAWMTAQEGARRKGSAGQEISMHEAPGLHPQGVGFPSAIRGLNPAAPVSCPVLALSLTLLRHTISCSGTGGSWGWSMAQEGRTEPSSEKPHLGLLCRVRV